MDHKIRRVEMRNLKQSCLGARARIVCVLAGILVAAGTPLTSSATAAPAIPSPPFTYCPAVGLDSGCALAIYVTDSGIGGAGGPAPRPDDGGGGTLIGGGNLS